MTEAQTGYFDDSGSHSQSEWYVLAGFVAPIAHWTQASDKWSKILAEEELRYFKMSEAMSMEGQFARGWTVPLRNQLIMKLVGVIEEISPPRIECFLRRSEFDAFIKGIIRGSTFNDPYFILFYHLILSVAVNDQLSWNRNCGFVFDDQGKLGSNALERWNWVKQNIDGLQGASITKNLGEPPVFRNDIQVRPLQAADMFAWLVRDCLVKGGDKMDDISRAAIGYLEGRNILRAHVTKEMLMKLGASFLVGKARLQGHL